MRTDGQIKNKHIYFLDRHENVTGVVSTEATDETTVPLLSAKTNEELGSYDVIELEILANHSDSIQIPEDGSIVYHDEFMGWREYHITKLVDSDKDNAVTKEITGELSSVELLDAKFENSNYLEGTVGDMATKLLEGTRFTLGRFDFGIRSINLGHKGTAELKHKSVLECLYFIAGKADCDMYFSYKVDGNKVYSRQVNFIKKLGDDNGKRFEVGKDVNSVTREIDYSNVKTAIIPTGDFEEEQKEVTEDSTETPVTMSLEDSETGISDVKKELTIENVVWKKPDNPTDKPKGQKFLADLDSLARWGRKDSKGQLIHSFVHVHFSIKDDKELAKMAWVELGKYKNPKITYELDVMDLYNLTGQSEHKHENVVLGDVVSVIDRYFPKPMAVKSRVMKIERDLIDPTNNKVTLGDLYQTYTSQAISNESMIAGKLDDLVDKTEKVVTAIVTDRQTNNYGSTEPVNPKKGDLWFRPHPQKPGENQMLIWDGVQWVVQLDTSVNTDAYERTKDIEKDLEQSKQEILDVREQAEKGIEKANQTIKDINSETQKELARVQAEADKALQESKDLINGVSGELSEQNKEIAEVRAKADKALQEGTELLNNVDSLKQTVDKQGLDIQKTNDSLKVKADKTEIDSLTQVVSKQGSELSVAKNSINLKADKTTVDSLKQTVDKQGTELAVTKDSINLKADKSQVNALDKTVKQQASELTVQSDMIKAQASKVDGNSTQLANLKLESDRLSSTVSKTESKIDNLDIPYRNLLVNSNNYYKSNVGDYGLQGYTTETDSIKVILQAGKTYTFSSSCKSGSSTSLRLYIQYPKTWGVQIIAGTSNTKRHLMHKTFTVPFEDNKGNKLDEKNEFTVNFHDMNKTGGVEVWWATLVEGEKGVSTWNPSAKDFATTGDIKSLETSINQTNTDIKLKADKTEVNSLSQDISKQYSELQIANNKINLKADKTEVSALENTVKKTVAELDVQSDKIKAQASKVENNSTQLANMVIESGKISNTVSKLESDAKNSHNISMNLIKSTQDLSSNLYKSTEIISEGPELQQSGVSIAKRKITVGDSADTLRFFTSDKADGEVYTLSFYARANKNTTIDNFFYNPNTTIKAETVQGKSSSFVDGKVEVHIDTAWRMYWIRWFQKPTDKEKEIIIGRFYDKESTVYITKPMLVKGSLRKEWKPSLEDMATQQELSTVVQTVDSLTTVVQGKAEKSQIVQLSNQISAVVSDNKNNSSSINVLQGAIQSTVKKGDVISSINQSPEKITLDAKRIHITGETTIDNAAIRSAAIRDLSADKIITGTLDARQVRVIGLDAGSIATGTLDAIRIGANSITADKLAANAIQVGFNNMGKNIKISPTELSFYRDGTLTGKVTDNGQEYWYGSRYLGSTGETFKAGSPSIRGIGHQLNHQGDFISWSFKETASASTYTSMLLLDPKGKRTGHIGIHVQQPMWVSELATTGGSLKIINMGGTPAITSPNKRTGILFEPDNLTLIHGNKSYNMNNLFRLMNGIGTGSFAMPVSFASDGTANSWVNFTI